MLLGSVLACSTGSAEPTQRILTEAPPPTEAAPAGETFTSEEGKFSVVFPGDPELSTQDVAVQDTTSTMNIAMYATDQVAYMVAFNDYPEDMVAGNDPDTMLDGARDGAVSNVSGTLDSEERITINDFPGRYLVVSVEGGRVYLRIYIVNNRLYQAMVVNPDSGGISMGEITDFLDSFTLTE
jgi:hypothetical protein